jgi:hypothetical protein
MMAWNNDNINIITIIITTLIIIIIRNINEYEFIKHCNKTFHSAFQMTECNENQQKKKNSLIVFNNILNMSYLLNKTYQSKVKI